VPTLPEPHEKPTLKYELVVAGYQYDVRVATQGASQPGR